MKKRILSALLCLVLCLGMVSSLAGCKKGAKADALVIMTEQLDGLFNPFFATSANDSTIVGMTQIGMLSSKFVNGKVEVAYGDNEAVVVKDYDVRENGDTTTYTFVLKNGILFSDGQPLTMEDVLFNLYVYLDPVYTGSSTLYSTDIVGLEEYRTQTAGNSSNADSLIAKEAAARADARIKELLSLFTATKKASATSEVSKADMIAAINGHDVGAGYKNAISNDPSKVTNKDLLADYEHTLELFRKELETDYASAQESYHDAPYKGHSEFDNEVFCFMYTEGYVETEYKQVNGKDDRSEIVGLTPLYGNITTKEAAIEYVFNDKISRELDVILQYWATAGTLTAEYTAKAKEVILYENVTADGLAVPNISGIVSLGHTQQAGSTIQVNNTSYTVASGHNSDGTVTNANEYDVLQITINGVDPKAIWNFAITVAPQHYYGEGSSVGVDIPNNKFGVEFAKFEFMSKIIQSPRNVKVPVGAGAYKATDRDNNDQPGENNFFDSQSNVVYFKANTNFHTVGTGLENAKIEKIRYQIVSSNNAIDALKNGTVHYISPSLTANNYDQLTAMAGDGYEMITTDQLGYGYIGINAAKVPDISLRKAIMCAMNTQLALEYYRTNTAEQIFWPMSTVSWAYPDGPAATDNGRDYPQMGTFNEDIAIANIRRYMEEAGVSGGESELKITFTIAGTNLEEHPTYKVFRDAAALLNSLGWEINVVPDSTALTKISTGSLAVWAAAWSSALDPDMYQVYHKDSTATSTLAWGYNHLKVSGSAEETQILDKLSDLIDQARETTDQNTRADLYEQAMGYVLDLAVELPVYQRDVLYAFNANVINTDTMPSDINPYSSPLDRIWELEFAN